MLGLRNEHKKKVKISISEMKQIIRQKNDLYLYKKYTDITINCFGKSDSKIIEERTDLNNELSPDNIFQ